MDELGLACGSFVGVCALCVSAYHVLRWPRADTRIEVARALYAAAPFAFLAWLVALATLKPLFDAAESDPSAIGLRPRYAAFGAVYLALASVFLALRLRRERT